ncbi:MAG TPA: sodium-dependent bicarbonate transport family permease [Cytophagales bacterium]|nr:sodium-dependent bicarbonate transport family permease [Cytophagales bacterium]
MVLAFALGIIAKRIKSDLKFPEGLYQSLTMYLLVAIGMKGGHKLSLASFDEVFKPALAAVALCCSIPLWTYWIMRKAARLDVPNAAALAAHYGSVSAVTFSTAIVFHESLGIKYEGFMPSLLAMMEIPAIIIAISLARLNTSAKSGSKVSIKEIALELLAGKSSVLLIGFLVIGFFIGNSGWEQVAPLFDTPFKGILTLFLLEAGLKVGERLNELKKNGLFLVGFGIVFPVMHAMLGIFLGHLAGLGLGGSTILGVLAASASYIAAPAACRVALPEANPSFYLTGALAITFPFNILIGLPLYHEIAEKMIH